MFVLFRGMGSFQLPWIYYKCVLFAAAAHSLICLCRFFSPSQKTVGVQHTSGFEGLSGPPTSRWHNPVWEKALVRCWVLPWSMQEAAPGWRSFSCSSGVPPQLPGQQLHGQTPVRVLWLLRQTGFLSIFLTYFFCALSLLLGSWRRRKLFAFPRDIWGSVTYFQLVWDFVAVSCCWIFPIPFLLVKSYFFRSVTLVPDLSNFLQQQQWVFCSIWLFFVGFWVVTLLVPSL